MQAPFPGGCKCIIPHRYTTILQNSGIRHIRAAAKDALAGVIVYAQVWCLGVLSSTLPPLPTRTPDHLDKSSSPSSWVASPVASLLTTCHF